MVIHKGTEQERCFSVLMKGQVGFVPGTPDDFCVAFMILLLFLLLSLFLFLLLILLLSLLLFQKKVEALSHVERLRDRLLAVRKTSQWLLQKGELG